ncbi:hypothetical protein A33Q_0589 [Indibacter alkaliphilus LW1]|uniref:Uncharacterized protein n=1 Tax=Indibacter alkaliphilus (strain CCUG 57479 / KCTC 22604 / LW1) TaxID=1189612 RepID=S2E3U6_INDAL|nr:hypothetical protein A33Q_0589 [Indibacter alkaliphilus LW1]
MCANFLKVQSFILMIFENIFSISRKVSVAKATQVSVRRKISIAI